VLSGLGALACFAVRLPVTRGAVPLGLCSLACAVIYNISMHSDPLSQYQIDKYGDEARVIPETRLKRKTGAGAGIMYLVLVRRNDTARLYLHTTLGLMSGLLALRSLYYVWKA
jgi:hypothetical protein